MKLLPALVLGLSLYPVIGAAAEENLNCTDVEMNQVSYYSVASITKEQSVSEIYKQKIEQLKAFGKKHQLKRFKILSHDVSTNQNSYIQGAFELSISMTFESAFDYTLVDKIRSELQSNSISSSRILSSVCQ
ncbi:hypothetical protein [Psychromonas sp. SP041]|uniref:hypothetical protein n=1 Tax=Psychromonas sp. SP041 TaxID=1365007 RepID=UPI000404259B|nr:hypothetical protein [Psychromonas sp. SP041]